MRNDTKGAETAVQQIRGALEAAVESIRPELEARLKEAYRGEVDRKFKQLLRLAQDPNSLKVRLGAAYHISYRYYEYATINTEKARQLRGAAQLAGITGQLTWEVLRDHPEVVEPYYYYADKFAKMSFQTARNSFVRKNVQKFSSILRDRAPAKSVAIKFEYRAGVFEGKLVLDDARAHIEAQVSLKYVVRTVPRVTPYYQYPLIFTHVAMGGRKVGRVSEKELIEMFAGASNDE